MIIMKLQICTGDASDRRYCLVTSHPSRLSYPLSHGRDARTVFDELDLAAVRLDLDEAGGGLALPDMVGNDLNYLILRRPCADVLRERFALGPHDALPASLFTRKERLHADDYVILNPLGKVDCLDIERSDMDDDDDDEPTVQLFGTFMLDRRRIPADRDIFRVRGVPLGYMFSERLVDFIRAQGYTNFVFKPVALS